MSYYDDEVLQAYYKSLTPGEVMGDDVDGYVLLTDLMTKDMHTLLKLLPPEHSGTVQQCYHNMHMYINFSNEFYFRAGWQAAKKDNELDHF